jgi:hypothetical protein
MRPENFVEKFFIALGFLSGVIAFPSSLIVTITWLHFLLPLGLNVNISSFLLMLSLMILAATSIVAPVVLKLVIDYLWYDTHACSVITESLIKFLSANQKRDGWNTWVIHCNTNFLQE